MKRLSFILLSLLVPSFLEAAPIFGTVQISSNSTFAPTLQAGGINITSATIRNATVVYGITASTSIFGNVQFSSHTSIMTSLAGNNMLSIPDTNTMYFGEGSGALQRAGTAGFNVAVGPRAMGASTTGTFSTVVGVDAVGGTFTGQQVNAIGYAAGNAMTSGSYDNCMGGSSCLNTTTGSNITAVGTLACRDCNSDSQVALGHQASQFHSSGSGGIDIGYQAGVGTTTLTNSDTSGSYNVHIGYQAGQSVSSSTVVDNCIAIGKQALCNTSNQAQIGGTNGTGNEVILRVSSATIQGTQLDVAGVTYRWPSAQASGSKVLSNDGSGNLSWAAGGSGYSTVQDEGSGLTQRATLNFTGAGVSCADNAGSSRTDCTISGGAGSGTIDVTTGTAAGSTGPSNAATAIVFSSSAFVTQKTASTTAYMDLNDAYKTGKMTFGFDGGGSTLSTGTTYWTVIPASATITKVTMTAQPSGSFSVIVSSSDAFDFTKAGRLCSGGCPAIVSGTILNDSTLTSWTTSVGKDGYLFVVSTGAATSTRANISIEYLKP